MSEEAPMDLSGTWNDESKKRDWYSGGIAYWEKTSETNDGVLGGYGIVHDVSGSGKEPPGTVHNIAPATDAACLLRSGGYRGFDEVH